MLLKAWLYPKQERIPAAAGLQTRTLTFPCFFAYTKMLAIPGSQVCLPLDLNGMHYWLALFSNLWIWTETKSLAVQDLQVASSLIRSRYLPTSMRVSQLLLTFVNLSICLSIDWSIAHLPSYLSMLLSLFV